jgi:hypothetical protein
LKFSEQFKNRTLLDLPDPEAAAAEKEDLTIRRNVGKFSPINAALHSRALEPTSQ